MKHTKNFFLFSFTVLFLSCTNDSESDLIDDTPITGTVSYSGTVKNIINTNCISCHGTTPTNGAPTSLTTYENVKDAVLTGGLLNRISRAEGTGGAMPLGGPRLTQTQINQINNWKDNGFLE